MLSCHGADGLQAMHCAAGGALNCSGGEVWMRSLGGSVVDALKATVRRGSPGGQEPSVPPLRRAKCPRLNFNLHPEEFQLLFSTQSHHRAHASVCIFLSTLVIYFNAAAHGRRKAHDGSKKRLHAIARHLQIPAQVRRVHNSSAWVGPTTVLI